MTAFMTFLLICSSVTMVKALESIKNKAKGKFKNFMLMTIAGGVIFLSLQAYEWNHLIHGANLGLSENTYGDPLFGTTFFMITSFHGLHVTGGVILLTWALVSGRRRDNFPDYYTLAENVGLCWNFEDLVWILVFTFLYLL
ncbi:MAG: cytochrome c oxidase subunit 3 [Nitrospinota bacterium]|nr:cytochrome c oxidase subunit 3 [Nitrospinota bacterium]